ncbi:MAG TPA: ADP-ribosylglycohydrolase family protein [Tepidisphaeraceae bacterium]|jgi:ADP-ribosylglycohydrolase|nr:ADP-ribosylglycohydrolase family protein [Tepidisphaeraceae bacterium]
MSVRLIIVHYSSEELLSSLVAIHGSIVGTIVGDALGLPYEALSRRRGEKLLGPPNRYHFVFGRGMMSDDGEHTCMVAQSLCESGGDVQRFSKALARRMRWWMLGVPAGIGGATLRSIFRLWIGVSSEKSGVFSAGNGPAMRAAILGVAIDDIDRLRKFVVASTRITHTDPKALHGATAVAIAARCAAENAGGACYLDRVRTALSGDDPEELVDLLTRAVASAEHGTSTPAFADSIGCTRGVSGYMYHTVPVAIHAWRRHPNSYVDAVTDAILCGGDTDTLAAIAGGIVGAHVGIEGIPQNWREGLLEWPRTQRWIAQLAECVHHSATNRITAPRVNPLVIARNALFALIVLMHIARRALPPY